MKPLKAIGLALIFVSLNAQAQKFKAPVAFFGQNEDPNLAQTAMSLTPSAAPVAESASLSLELLEASMTPSKAKVASPEDIAELNSRVDSKLFKAFGSKEALAQAIGDVRETLKGIQH